MRSHSAARRTIHLALGALFVAFVMVGAPFLSAGQVLAQGASTVQTRNVGALGTVLTGANGMTLYTFDRDTTSVSACNDQCAALWPPLVLESGAPVPPAGLGGALSVSNRADGRRQVVYNNQPLYFYMPDTQPGDTKGEGVGGVWHVAKAVLTTAPAAAGAATAPTTQQAPTPAPQAAGALPRTGTGLTADQQIPGASAWWAFTLAAVALSGMLVRIRRLSGAPSTRR